jgi:hypothetical protein
MKPSLLPFCVSGSKEFAASFSSSPLLKLHSITRCKHIPSENMKKEGVALRDTPKVRRYLTPAAFY